MPVCETLAFRSWLPRRSVYGSGLMAMDPSPDGADARICDNSACRYRRGEGGIAVARSSEGCFADCGEDDVVGSTDLGLPGDEADSAAHRFKCTPRETGTIHLTQTVMSNNVVGRRRRGEAVMGCEVFISHASGDAVLAQAIVHALEAAELSCWIAPRNILPGTDYAEAIIEAIEEAAVMVVVVSDEANRSRHVPREVERAIARDVSLVPFRIADIAPSKSLEYFLSSQHWLHALPPPVEAHIAKLVDAVSALVRLRRSVTVDMSTVTITSAARRRPIRVPAAVAVFTGRAVERQKIAHELTRTVVVTLVGPPGAGKSELARKAAAELGTRVVFVDLSTVTVTSSLTSVITAACGLDPAWDWRDVLAALDDTDTILLLDNAETALADRKSVV